MSIRDDVQFLQELKTEIKIRAGELKKIREQAKATHERIIQYCVDRDLPGVKYGEIAVIVEDKDTRAPKKKKDKDEDAIRVLEDSGVHNATKVLEELLEARRGEKIAQKKVKINKMK